MNDNERKYRSLLIAVRNLLLELWAETDLNDSLSVAVLEMRNEITNVLAPQFYELDL